MAEAVADHPIEQKTEIVNPVLKPDQVETSMNLFNEQMKAVQEEESPNDITKETPPATSAPEKEEPKSPTTPEGKPKSKTVLPEEIFTPADEEKLGEKPNEAIAEIDSMTLPKSAKPETIANFNSLKETSKKHLKQVQDKIAELERKLSEASKNGDAETWQKKVTEAEKARKEVEDQFARVAFEQSPAFRSKFIDREQAAIEGARASLEGTEVNPDLINVAAHATPANRIKMLREAGAESEVISAVTAYLAQFDGVQRDKNKAIENWRTEVAQDQERNEREQAQQRVKRREQEDQIWGDVLSRMDLIPLRKAKNNEDWNSRVESIKEEAKKIYNGDGVTLEDLSETILKGRAYDALNDVVAQLVEQNKNLRSQNSKIKAAKPGGEMTQTTTAVPTQDHEKMSREESAKSIFNEQMAMYGAH
jgi:hypothetical protein